MEESDLNWSLIYGYLEIAILDTYQYARKQIADVIDSIHFTKIPLAIESSETPNFEILTRQAPMVMTVRRRCWNRPGIF